MISHRVRGTKRGSDKMCLSAHTQWLDFLRGLLLGFVPVWPFMAWGWEEGSQCNCMNCACVWVWVVRIGWGGGGGGRRRLRIRELELQSVGGGGRGASPFVGFSSAAPAIPSALFCRVLPVGCSCGLPPCALHLNEARTACSKRVGAPWCKGQHWAQQPQTPPPRRPALSWASHADRTPIYIFARLRPYKAAPGSHGILNYPGVRTPFLSYSLCLLDPPSPYSLLLASFSPCSWIWGGGLQEGWEVHHCQGFGSSINRFCWRATPTPNLALCLFPFSLFSPPLSLGLLLLP